LSVIIRLEDRRMPVDRMIQMSKNTGLPDQERVLMNFYHYVLRVPRRRG
jgi:hypothetical protein